MMSLGALFIQALPSAGHTVSLAARSQRDLFDSELSAELHNEVWRIFAVYPLKIDVTTLNFQPMPVQEQAEAAADDVVSLTIPHGKAGLANALESPLPISKSSFVARTAMLAVDPASGMMRRRAGMDELLLRGLLAIKMARRLRVRRAFPSFTR